MLGFTGCELLFIVLIVLVAGFGSGLLGGCGPED